MRERDKKIMCHEGYFAKVIKYKKKRSDTIAPAKQDKLCRFQKKPGRYTKRDNNGSEMIKLPQDDGGHQGIRLKKKGGGAKVV